MEETERFLQGVEKDIVCLRERLAQIDSRPPVEEMTVDDFYEMYPEQRTLFYDSLRNEDWSSTARPT